MMAATLWGVGRLGIALEPEADYELQPDGSGGCEDQRITFGGEPRIETDREIRASFHRLQSATKQRLLPWSLPNPTRKTVFFFVLFHP